MEYTYHIEAFRHNEDGESVRCFVHPKSKSDALRDVRAFENKGCEWLKLIIISKDYDK